MSRRTRVFLFFAIQGLFNLGANFAHPVTPTFFNNLGLGDYMFGVALASMSTANFIVSPFWGKINTYISSRAGLLVGCMGYALGQLFFSLAGTEGQVVGARVFAGLFTSGAFVSILTYIVNTNKDDVQRGYYLAAAATIQAICSAFGYLIGGLIGEVSVFAAFMTQVVTLALCGILFFFVCEDDAKVSLSDVKLGTVIKESNPFAAFWESRSFMTSLLFMLLVMVILQNTGNTSFDQSFNYFLKDQFNMTSGYNGAIKGATGIITLIANATITLWIINKTDVKKSIIWVFTVIAVTMLSAIFTTSLPIPFVILNIVCYAFSAVSLPVLQGMVAESSTGSNSNLVMGLYNAMKNVGTIIGALVAGFLYNIQPVMPFFFGFVSYLTASLLAVAYCKKFIKNETQK